MLPQPALQGRIVETAEISRWRAAYAVSGPLQLLDVDAPILHCIGGIGDVRQSRAAYLPRTYPLPHPEVPLAHRQARNISRRPTLKRRQRAARSQPWQLKSLWIIAATLGIGSIRRTRSLLSAEERFRQLSDLGYTAAVRNVSGDPTIVRNFDPTAKETLFFPRLVGG